MPKASSLDALCTEQSLCRYCCVYNQPYLGHNSLDQSKPQKDWNWKPMESLVGTDGFSGAGASNNKGATQGTYESLARCILVRGML